MRDGGTPGLAKKRGTKQKKIPKSLGKEKLEKRKEKKKKKKREKERG